MRHCNSRLQHVTRTKKYGNLGRQVSCGAGPLGRDIYEGGSKPIRYTQQRRPRTKLKVSAEDLERGLAYLLSNDLDPCHSNIRGYSMHTPKYLETLGATFGGSQNRKAELKAPCYRCDLDVCLAAGLEDEVVGHKESSHGVSRGCWRREISARSVFSSTGWGRDRREILDVGGRSVQVLWQRLTLRGGTCPAQAARTQRKLKTVARECERPGQGRSSIIVGHATACQDDVPPVSWRSGAFQAQ